MTQTLDRQLAAALQDDLVRQVSDRIQINIPFRMLRDQYLDLFIRHRLNPEIGFDADVLEHCAQSDFRAVAEKLQQQDVTVTFHAPFMDLSAGSPDPAIREVTRRRFDQILALVPMFQPKSVVCHAGYDRTRYGFNYDDWLHHSLQTWSRLSERLQQSGVQLMLENVYEQEPSQIRPIFESLGDAGVGFCLDMGHLHAFGKASPQPWLEAMGSFLGQLHLHDNAGDWDEHLALGCGRIDYTPLWAYLKARNTDPPIITIEPHDKADVWPNLRYLASVWPWPLPARGV
jgi:sugar phosphate isomerase/epimerase